MGLFKLYNCCAPGLLDYLKSYLKSVSRLHISEFSGCPIFLGASGEENQVLNVSDILGLGFKI